MPSIIFCFDRWRWSWAWGKGSGHHLDPLQVTPLVDSQIYTPIPSVPSIPFMPAVGDPFILFTHVCLHANARFICLLYKSLKINAFSQHPHPLNNPTFSTSPPCQHPHPPSQLPTLSTPPHTLSTHPPSSSQHPSLSIPTHPLIPPSSTHFFNPPSQPIQTVALRERQTNSIEVTMCMTCDTPIPRFLCPWSRSHIRCMSMLMVCSIPPPP